MANRPGFSRDSSEESQLFGLLPIANRPIFVHLLAQFERYGLNNITLVCLKKDKQKYNDFLLQSYTTRSIRTVPVDGVCTTCDIIRMLSRNNNNHILLYPIDLLMSENLTGIIDFHIASQSLITLVTTKYKVDEKELRQAPGPQIIRQNTGGKRYFVYDESDPHRLVTLLSDNAALGEDLDLSLKRVERDESMESMKSCDSNELDEPDGMGIRHDHLTGFRSLLIDGSLSLTNAYVLSPKCVEYLSNQQNQNIHSIESELIPQICLKGLNKNKSVSPQFKPIKASIYCTSPDEFSFRISDISMLFYANLKCATDKLKGFKPKADFISLDNSTGAGYYVEGSPQENFNYQPNCVYGANLSFEKDVSINRSIIGRHCKIGKGVKIYNSVLCDHVSIDDNTIIKNCIIGEDSIIKENSKLSQCNVVSRFTSDHGINKEKCIVQLGDL